MAAGIPEVPTLADKPEGCEDGSARAKALRQARVWRGQLEPRVGREERRWGRRRKREVPEHHWGRDVGPNLKGDEARCRVWSGGVLGFEEIPRNLCLKESCA